MDHLQRNLLSAFVAGIVLNFAGQALAQSAGSAENPMGETPASGMSNTMNQPTGQAGTTGASTVDDTSGNPSNPGNPSGMGSTSGAGSTRGSRSASDLQGSSVYDASSTTPLAFDSPAAGGGDGGYSWLPYTTRGYVGVNGGQAQIDDLPCSPFYSCDDNSNSAFKVYTGGMFNNHFGLELAYFNTGNIDRSGGRVRAHGGNLSFVAQAPLGKVAAVYAKVGASYAWTKTSVGPLAVGTPSGEESDAGASYGVGVRFNASKNWAVVVEWEQHELQFAGDEKQGTMFTTVGLQYRF